MKGDECYENQSVVIAPNNEAAPERIVPAASNFFELGILLTLTY